MPYLTNLSLHNQTVSRLGQRVPSLRFIVLRLVVFVVLCLCMTQPLDASAAAAGCGTPVFNPPAVFPTEPLRSFASADFNGDGALDLAVIAIPTQFDTNLGSLWLYYGDGAGGFSSIVHLGHGKGELPHSVIAGDFDGDGRADVAIANAISGRGDVSVYLSADNFRTDIPLQWTSAGSRSGVSSMMAADLNADGKSDVVATSGATNEVFVALGGAGGNFTNIKTFSSGDESPAHVVAVNFDDDGKLDLVVANRAGGTFPGNVAVLRGDGAGDFSAPTIYPVGTPTHFITLGRFTGDGIGFALSLKVKERFNNEQADIVFLRDFNSRAFFTTTPGVDNSGKLVAEDFNGDGFTDLAMMGVYGDVSILLSVGTGDFKFSSTIHTGEVDKTAILLAPDMNGDGKPDLVIGHDSGRSISVWLNACGATTLSFDNPEYLGREQDKAVTLTVTRSGSLDGALTVDYTTSDGKERNRAVSPSDYTATSGTLSFASGEASKTLTLELANDTLYESSEMFSVRLSNLKGSPAFLGRRDARVYILDDDPALTFSVNNASVTEGEGRAVVTVRRTSNASGIAFIDYRTQHINTFTAACPDTLRNRGAAYARCDFATTVGRLVFAPGETQKTLTIPIIDDAHDEGTETFRIALSNPSRLDVQTTSTGTITIRDDDAAGAANPIFTTPFFVRQHYLDFLSREPEAGEPWSDILNRCPNVNSDPSCDRIKVSQSFYGSPEFQMKGFYVFRLYKVASELVPEYAEFIADMSFLDGATEAEVYARKAQLADLLTWRREGVWPGYSSMVKAQFVGLLLGRYQLTQITTPDPAQPDGTAKVTFTRAALVNALNDNTLTPGQVLRAVADSDEVTAREFNNAFVAMQYYGYLRRTPEPAGYNAWLGVLQRGDIRTMVNGFVNSTEYKLRFGGL
jgi:hypothetical protein